MDTWSRHGALLVVVLLAIASSSVSARGTTGAQDGEQAKRWGVFAELAGSRWNSDQSSGRGHSFRWDKPNERMLEEWGDPVGGVVATYFITLGSMPGTLEYRSEGFGKTFGKPLLGVVQPDGSVRFLKKVGLQKPFEIRINAEGVLERRPLLIRGNEMLGYGESKYSKYTLASGSAPSHVTQERGQAVGAGRQASVAAESSADELEAAAAALLEKARKQRAEDRERVAGSTRPHIEAAVEPQTQVAVPASTAAAPAPPDFGILEDMVGLWIQESGEIFESGRVFLSVIEISLVDSAHRLVINTSALGNETTERSLFENTFSLQMIYGMSPDFGNLIRVSANGLAERTIYEKTYFDERHSELKISPEGYVRFYDYMINGKGKKIPQASSDWRMVADGRMQITTKDSARYFRRFHRSNVPEVVAAVQESEREFQRNKAQSKRERSDAFWSGLINVLQVTGAVITEHAAQTQASLDATLARAAAQDIAQRQHQAGVQARAEAQRQADATQYTENASSAGLDAQNQANLARMQQSLMQARQQGLDPALIASMQEAVDGVEESLRDDGGDTGLAQQEVQQRQEEQQQRRQQEQQLAEQQRQADARERQRLAEQERERAAQARREQAEQAKQEQQQALRDHLAAEQRGIRLRALTCPGGGSNYFVTGNRPSISPRVAQCISVRFEARCPATRPGQGHVDVAGNFVGGNSCVGDTRKIPALSCPAEQVVVDVLDVTTCN